MMWVLVCVLGPLELEIGGCEPPDAGASSQLRGLCKSSNHSEPQSSLSSPYLFSF